MNESQSGVKELLRTSFQPIYSSLFILFGLVGFALFSNKMELGMYCPSEALGGMALLLSANVWSHVRKTELSLRDRLKTAAPRENKPPGND